ncbi:MAG TPA: hypothetical protein VJ817_16040 [Gemmatimonadales bacterium]|nr:hypothetical protein [Gemmatimonadales bacterium]
MARRGHPGNQGDSVRIAAALAGVIGWRREYRHRAALRRILRGFHQEVRAGPGRLVGPVMVAQATTGYIATEYGGRDGFGLETRDWNGVRIVGHGGAYP